MTDSEFVGLVMRALREMGALRAVQAMLRRRSLQSGRSWEEIGASVLGHVVDGRIDRDTLKDLVVDLRSRAQKLISIYRVADDVHAQLWEWCESEHPPHALSERFPFALSADDLARLETKSVLYAKRLTESGYELFFTSARIGTRTEPIEIEDIAADVRANYADADRLYAERIERRQAFDVIFVPRDSKVIQMRVDTSAIRSRDHGDDIRDQLQVQALDGASLAPLFFLPVGLFESARVLRRQVYLSQAAMAWLS